MVETSPALADPAGILDPASVERDKPRHSVFWEEVQYCAKWQTFKGAPPELTIQKVDFGSEVQAYIRAAHAGLSHVPPRARAKRKDPGESRDPESVERSQRRAKTTLRLLVTQLAPRGMVTFTTRKTYPLDDLAAIWRRFVALAYMVDPELKYVCVPEPHPSNPDHFHLHAAWRGVLNIDTLRRLWHVALEAHEGRRVSRRLEGPASPGNIDVRSVKGRDVNARVRKIARYISKYITKDLIERFNRRRYWPAKGIDLPGARRFWLDATDQASAIREACELLGCWDEVAPAGKLWAPSDRVAFIRVEPVPNPP